MISPISRHLSRFASELPVATLAPESETAEPLVTLAAADLEARLEQARCQAVADTLAASGRQIAQLKADLSAAGRDALATAHAVWITNQASVLSASCDAALASMRDLLCSCLADVLRPIISDAVVERAVASLSEALDQLVADPSHPLVTVHGPTKLIAALEAVRGGRAGVHFQEADTCEVTMTAEGSRVETRLAAALAALSADLPTEVS